ncbi:hypothetical protein KFE25_004106, partial [Diacronema lutheri]
MHAHVCALLFAATRATARVAPYSRLNPAELGVDVVKRGKEQAPAADRWAAMEGAPDAAGSLARPTNAWWTNFVLGQGPSELENANGFAIPYVLWPAKRGISAGLPFVLAQANQIENGFDSTISFVTLGASDVRTGHRVARSDALSVSLEWEGTAAAPTAHAGAGGAGPHAHAPIVRGSPYLTMEYRGTTPFFDSAQSLDPQVGFAVDGEPGVCPGKFRGRRFEFVLVETDETWVVWSSHEVEVGCQTDGALLQAAAPLSDGVWRAALTNNCTLGRSAHHCRKSPPADPEPPIFADILEAHAVTYPISAEVDLHAAGDDAAVRIRWGTRTMGDGSNGGRGKPAPALLMSAMEHHRRMGLCGGAGGKAEMVDGVYQRNMNGGLSLVIANE